MIIAGSPIIKSRMSRLESEVSSLSPLVNEIKDTLMSELLDTVERVKNELRLRTDKKLEVITEDANTLKDRLATLESGGITRKESLKSELAEQIRPLRKRITDLEAENKTIRAELTQLKMKLATVAKDTHHHHHHQSLHREGRWGTTDDFATGFLHLYKYMNTI